MDQLRTGPRSRQGRSPQAARLRGAPVRERDGHLPMSRREPSVISSSASRCRNACRRATGKARRMQTGASMTSLPSQKSCPRIGSDSPDARSTGSRLLPVVPRAANCGLPKVRNRPEPSLTHQRHIPGTLEVTGVRPPHPCGRHRRTGLRIVGAPFCMAVR